MPYAPVTPQRLALFLDRLTRAYRRPGRLYLVGGTGLLYQGIKDTTKDIDVTAQLAPIHREEFTQVLLRLRHELNMAIEEVSPGDFIPLPQGVEERHLYLGRRGDLEIFAFDPVSTALAKLARSRPQDISDVLGLLRRDQLRLEMLITAFEEILPRVVAGEALRISASEFRLRVSTFVRVAAEQGFPLSLPSSEAAYDPSLAERDRNEQGREPGP